MVDSGMIDHGYMYVNIDDCWSMKPGSKDPTLQGEARDKRGMINSNPRFPDMKALTDLHPFAWGSRRASTRRRGR